MLLALATASKARYEQRGTNIFPSLPPGDPVVAYAVNGRWFPTKAPIHPDGQPIMISLASIRQALANGAPRKEQRRT